ncbi:MAG: hypothetical protein POG74_02680 [Acidocella sp.]|nr:hypothetical protein [Acidocella sp.]
MLKLDNDGSCAGKGEIPNLISLIGCKDKPARAALHINENCGADLLVRAGVAPIIAPHEKITGKAGRCGRFCLTVSAKRYFLALKVTKITTLKLGNGTSHERVYEHFTRANWLSFSHNGDICQTAATGG